MGECYICADHARVEALIGRSSLGSAEAKAVRESVPNEVGIAIARAAAYLHRAEVAEEKVARVEALAKQAKAAEATSLSRTFEGGTFGAWVRAEDLRAALTEDQR